MQSSKRHVQFNTCSVADQIGRSCLRSNEIWAKAFFSQLHGQSEDFRRINEGFAIATIVRNVLGQLKALANASDRANQV